MSDSYGRWIIGPLPHRPRHYKLGRIVCRAFGHKFEEWADERVMRWNLSCRRCGELAMRHLEFDTTTAYQLAASWDSLGPITDLRLTPTGNDD